MKKFTLIEADKYINIDGLGIFFTEENWPFADIEHLWAIQWKDNGTEDGVGEVEYDSGAVANTPATRALIDRYVNHFNEEKERQTQEKLKREEEEKKQALSWQEAMAELENQMEEMQKRHDANLREQTADHDSQMERVHKRVAEAHENLFYGEQRIQENLSESERSFEFEAGYENLTVFDGNVDPTLFDDAVDESMFEVEEAEVVPPESIETKSLIDGDFEDVKTAEDTSPTVTDFDDVDMSMLDSEFNLELLFEEDSTEQVVSEIEELIAEEESEVPDASIPDNEPTTD
tara:strand:+ start:15586 stop:16455 length:870 start_codon:yes stop_codon:yes gene_type:complete